ncbi:hypothetical protein FPV67DRAFT_564097 [Lyophyllum atratum]|nr:hypothetical protein FPV67DRAFT_1076240 [Lyophyllum atratum]KAF8057448.1 hypothetical protein FPV67DRAFT_564097 [Lyophyllum atratum]
MVLICLRPRSRSRWTTRRSHPLPRLLGIKPFSMRRSVEWSICSQFWHQVLTSRQSPVTIPMSMMKTTRDLSIPKVTAQCPLSIIRRLLPLTNLLLHQQLYRLPYFDICRMVVIDPMHNLLLSVVKTHFHHIWVQNDILRKTKEVFLVQIGFGDHQFGNSKVLEVIRRLSSQYDVATPKHTLARNSAVCSPSSFKCSEDIQSVRMTCSIPVIWSSPYLARNAGIWSRRFFDFCLVSRLLLLFFFALRCFPVSVVHALYRSRKVVKNQSAPSCVVTETLPRCIWGSRSP